MNEYTKVLNAMDLVIVDHLLQYVQKDLKNVRDITEMFDVQMAANKDYGKLVESLNRAVAEAMKFDLFDNVKIAEPVTYVEGKTLSRFASDNFVTTNRMGV